MLSTKAIMDFTSFENINIGWIVVYIVLLILWAYVMYKLLFKGIDRPTFDNIVFLVEIKEQRAFLFWSLIIAVLYCIFGISEGKITITYLAILGIIMNSLDLSKTTTNELVLLDDELVIIKRDKIVKRASLNKMEKVIFKNEKVKLYTTRYLDEVELKNVQRDKQALISILGKMEIKVFDN